MLTHLEDIILFLSFLKKATEKKRYSIDSCPLVKHKMEGISPVNRILLPFIHEIYDFHPLLCPLRTSRFLTPKLSRQGVGPLPPAEASRPLCYEYKKVHLASVCAR